MAAAVVNFICVYLSCIDWMFVLSKLDCLLLSLLQFALVGFKSAAVEGRWGCCFARYEKAGARLKVEWPKMRKRG